MVIRSSVESREAASINVGRSSIRQTDSPSFDAIGSGGPVQIDAVLAT